jgi:hypothetical protein
MVDKLSLLAIKLIEQGSATVTTLAPIDTLRVDVRRAVSNVLRVRQVKTGQLQFPRHITVVEVEVITASDKRTYKITCLPRYFILLGGRMTTQAQELWDELKLYGKLTFAITVPQEDNDEEQVAEIIKKVKVNISRAKAKDIAFGEVYGGAKIKYLRPEEKDKPELGYYVIEAYIEYKNLSLSHLGSVR